MKVVIGIFLALALIAFFAFLICKLRFFKRLEIKPKYLLVLFATKLFFAFALLGVYEFVYDNQLASDMHKYHYSGKVLYSALRENPLDYFKMVSGICADEPQFEVYYDKADYWNKAWNYGLLNDNRTIIRYDALLNLFTQGNLYLNLIISAFVAFVGSCFLALVMKKFANGRKFIVAISAFLIPSVAFWSSGPMKECLVMFSVGVLAYSWMSLCEKFGLKKLFVAILSAFLLILAKFYVLMAMIPGMILFCLPSKIGSKKLLISFVGIFAIVITLFFFSGKLFGYDLVDTIVKKQHDFINMVNVEASDASSNIEIGELESNFISFAKNLVPAYINVIIRPFVTEADSFVKMVCCAENIAVLILFIYMCLRFKPIDNKQLKFVLFTLSFMLVFYALIGLTTPNLGALVRYKIPAMPFILFAMLMCTNFEKLKNKLPERLKNVLN